MDEVKEHYSIVCYWLCCDFDCHFYITQDSKNINAGDSISDHISPVLNDAIMSEEDLDSSSDEECTEEIKIGPLDHLSEIFTESDFMET